MKNSIYWDFGRKSKINKEQLQKFLDECKAKDYVSLTRGDVLNGIYERELEAEKIIKEFSQCFRGNCSFIVHTFFNEITQKNEITFSDKTVLNSYLRHTKNKIKYVKMF